MGAYPSEVTEVASRVWGGACSIATTRLEVAGHEAGSVTFHQVLNVFSHRLPFSSAASHPAGSCALEQVERGSAYGAELGDDLGNVLSEPSTTSFSSLSVPIQWVVFKELGESDFIVSHTHENPGLRGPLVLQNAFSSRWLLPMNQ